MRVLLTANASCVPPRGGSTRSNLVWLEYLAAQGHDVRVVAPAIVSHSEYTRGRVSSDLRDQEIRTTHLQSDPKLGFEKLQRGDITVYSVTDPGKLRQVLRAKIIKHAPDWVLVSSEDLGQALLREALEAAPDRVVYLAHTPQMFPFGPASLNPNSAGTSLVRCCAGIVVIGNHTAQYVEQHLGRRPAVIHPPVYGSGPFSRRDPSEDGLITMINASAVKGICIFLALAKRFPQYRFGALPGWGTTEADHRALEAVPNVEIMRKVKHIDQILMKTKILLIPALWHEGFGLVVMEAMLCGVPVLASNMGSLVEAKAGTRYVLPVRPIEQYRTVFDENRMPLPVIPEQDIEPWAAALQELMEDPELYRRESDAARDAAMRFVPTVKPSQFEEYLLNLPRAVAENVACERAESPAAGRSALAGLSPERRALLLKRVRERSAGPASND